MEETLYSKLVNFAELLRQEGIYCSTQEIIDVVESLKFLTNFDLETFYLVLRNCLVKNCEKFRLFDNAFMAFWLGSSEERLNEKKKNHLIELSILTFSRGLSYSSLEIYTQKKFKPVSAEEYRKLKLALKKFSKFFPTNKGRRFSIFARGSIDLRRSIRASLLHADEMYELKEKGRKKTRSSFVFLFDVSGSMDSLSENILGMMHICSNYLRAHVFAFSTKIELMDKYLQGRSVFATSQMISKYFKLWDSGTRIGFALKELIENYGFLLSEKTTLVIVSDGLDQGEIEVLASSMEKINKIVGSIVWINPLADTKGYVPKTSAMITALDYVDNFLGLKELLNLKTAYSKNIFRNCEFKTAQNIFDNKINKWTDFEKQRDSAYR